MRGQVAGEFPVAVLNEADRAWLGSASPVVEVSQRSLAAHRERHPEIGLVDYRRLPDIVAQGEVWQVPGLAERLIFVTLSGTRYRAVLKRTAEGDKNYMLTLFRVGKGNGVPAGAKRIQ